MKFILSQVGGNYIPEAAVEAALDLLTTFDSSTTKINIIDFSVSNLCSQKN